MSQWLRTVEQRIASSEGTHHALSDPRIFTYHFERDLNLSAVSQRTLGRKRPLESAGRHARQTSSKPEHFAGTVQRARIMQGRVRPERTSGPTGGEVMMGISWLEMQAMEEGGRRRRGVRPRHHAFRDRLPVRAREAA
jgi:hypothetical protein